MADSTPRCAQCGKGQSELPIPLKHCARCKGVSYCSRDCQKAHWRTHKRDCAAMAGQRATATQRFSIEKPFTALQRGTWLRDRPEKDVYQLLSDTFRLRREDKYKFEGDVQEVSVYAGGDAASELANYRRFLHKTTELDAARPEEKKLFPPWWSAEKMEEGVLVATNDKDAMVAYAVEKHDIQEFYKQDNMPMQLRMFSEALDGTTIGGQRGDAMLQMMVGTESGSVGAHSRIGLR